MLETPLKQSGNDENRTAYTASASGLASLQHLLLVKEFGSFRCEPKARRSEPPGQD